MVRFVTMKLIIFDIDGTIIDSVNADDHCFIQTFKHLYRIDLSNADWNDFTNVTDTGLTKEIFQKYLNREPNEKEIENIKTYFKNLLKSHVHQFIEIEKALSFIKLISTQPNFEIAFATGGWKETAELKCNTIGLNLNEYICGSSNDHFERGRIIEYAIGEALRRNGVIEFDSITYFGDGLWDLETTRKLGIDFIGVDAKSNGKLKESGAESVINGFTETNKILNFIN